MTENDQNISTNARDKLSTEPYKGVRDFYPEDMFIQNYIFDVMRKTAECFGFVEYSASALEPTALYEAKTGDEIVKEQTYTFTDRGERRVSLRPEMTPTLARMVAAKKRELSFPLRLYSIPNAFRYERPQKGRLREHWQLNADIVGAAGAAADAEIITLANKIMENFGAKMTDFEIRVNNKKLMNTLLFDVLNLDEKNTKSVSGLLDKKEKIPAADFEKEIGGILGEERTQALQKLLENKNLDDFLAASEELKNSEGAREISALLNELAAAGIQNVSFSPTLVRGLAYYTGNVFEIFDTNPSNNRSLFGGGRYDNLLEIFGAESVPAVGFGMGDIAIRVFLAERNLLPDYVSSTRLYLCTIDEESRTSARELANRLRNQGINVAVSVSDKKIGDQIKIADKQYIPYIICVGPEEIQNKRYKIKNLKTGEEKTVTEAEIENIVRKNNA